MAARTRFVKRNSVHLPSGGGRLQLLEHMIEDGED